MPRVLGYFDDGLRPVLAIEDLSDALWPPPWTKDQIDSVLTLLDEWHQLPPPGHLTRMEQLVAWVAGFFFSRAAIPEVPDAPHVRPLQLAQSRTALP